MSTWTAEQTREFLTVTAGDRMHAVWSVALGCALRRGELAALRWSDLDVERGTLTVTRNRVRVGPDVVEVKPKSGKGRTVAVPPSTLAALKVWRRRQLEERVAWAGAAEEPNDAMFTAENGAPINPLAISKRWDAAVKASGLPRLRLHDARHCAASLMLASGSDIFTVSRALGHANIQTTASVYAHQTETMRAEGAARLDAHVCGA